MTPKETFASHFYAYPIDYFHDYINKLVRAGMISDSWLFREVKERKELDYFQEQLTEILNAAHQIYSAGK